MKRGKRIIACLTGMLMLATCAACSGDEETGEAGTTKETKSKTTLEIGDYSLTVDEFFTDRDYETTYEDAIAITLSDDASSCEDSSVEIDGDVITITQAGTYLLEGELSDGQIQVDAEDEKVQLVLNGVSIENDSSACIYVLEADKVFITTVSDTTNTLASTGTFVQTDDNNVDAAIFSKDDLCLNGEGTLIVECAKGHGIVSKDDLKITCGTYAITSAKSGLNANDSIRIADGDITIDAGTDGMHAENDEDEDLGYIYIIGGNITIESGSDGIDAASVAFIFGGTIDILAGGGHENAEDHSDYMAGFGVSPGTVRGNYTEDDSFDTSESTDGKGIKGSYAVWVKDSDAAIDSADDGIHANSIVYVENGELDIVAGDDGIHADDALTIDEGMIAIEAYEGLEALEIVVNDGTIEIDTSDDGMNASGDGECTLTVNGGEIAIVADADCLDSNGSLSITGGTLYLYGPINSSNGIIDSQTSATITGGEVYGAGYAGMNENFDTDSTQGSILLNIGSTQSANTTVSLYDSDGDAIASYTPTISFQSILISTDELEEGETYTLEVGSISYSFTLDSLIYGSDNSMNMQNNMNNNMNGMNRMP